MNQIESEFFEEYKVVEKICSDMYGGGGLKAYLEDM